MTHLSQGKTLILKVMINKLPSTSQQQNNAQKHQLKSYFHHHFSFIQATAIIHYTQLSILFPTSHSLPHTQQACLQ